MIEHTGARFDDPNVRLERDRADPVLEKSSLSSPSGLVLEMIYSGLSRCF